MTTADWNSFESDPPNAVLAFLEPGDTAPEDAVIVITNRQLERGGPLSPVSVAGVRRRERRSVR